MNVDVFTSESIMLRTVLAGLGGFVIALALVACTASGYEVRSVPRIAADSIGKPLAHLTDVFGEPRKVDPAPNKLVYVWYLKQVPDGAPPGFHGCELEVTVDTRSDAILGYSLSNLGWTTCQEVSRKIRVDDL